MKYIEIEAIHNLGDFMSYLKDENLKTVHHFAFRLEMKIENYLTMLGGWWLGLRPSSDWMQVRYLSENKLSAQAALEGKQDTYKEFSRSTCWGKYIQYIEIESWIFSERLVLVAHIIVSIMFLSFLSVRLCVCVCVSGSVFVFVFVSYKRESACLVLWSISLPWASEHLWDTGRVPWSWSLTAIM